MDQKKTNLSPESRARTVSKGIFVAPGNGDLSTTDTDQKSKESKKSEKKNEKNEKTDTDEKDFKFVQKNSEEESESQIRSNRELQEDLKKRRDEHDDSIEDLKKLDPDSESEEFTAVHFRDSSDGETEEVESLDEKAQGGSTDEWVTEEEVSWPPDLLGRSMTTIHDNPGSIRQDGFPTLFKQMPRFHCLPAVVNPKIMSLYNPEFDGKWIVLFTYTHNFLPETRDSLLAVWNKIGVFAEMDCVVLGMSTDSWLSHRKFMAYKESRNGLGGRTDITLLSDETQMAAKLLGVLTPETGCQGQRFCYPAYFVFDPNHVLVEYAVVKNSKDTRIVKDQTRFMWPINEHVIRGLIRNIERLQKLFNIAKELEKDMKTLITDINEAFALGSLETIVAGERESKRIKKVDDLLDLIQKKADSSSLYRRSDTEPSI